MKKKTDIDIDKFFTERIESLPPENHSEMIINKSIDLLIEKKRNSQTIKPGIISSALQKSKRVYFNITDFFRYNRIWILKPQPLIASLSFIVVSTFSILLLIQKNEKNEPVIANIQEKLLHQTYIENPALQNHGNDIAVVEKIELTRLAGKEYGDIYLNQRTRGIESITDTSTAKKDSLKAYANSIIKDVLKSNGLKFKDTNNKIITQWDYSGPIKEGKIYKTRLIFKFNSNKNAEKINVICQKYLTNEKTIPAISIKEAEKKFNYIYDEIKTRIRR